MIIKKVYNNNVILATNKEDKEIVVMGCGLAFQKKMGEEIDPKKIEKVFASTSPVFSEHFSQLMSEVQPEYLEATAEIIVKAQQVIGKTLTENIYSFAISRPKTGYEIKNALLWEIKKFYPNEFAAGLVAIEVIKEHFDVVLGEDEAGFVALHFVNAQQPTNSSDITSTVTEILQTVTGVVQLHYGVVLDDTTLNYARFITHLQFFVRRVLQSEANNEEDDFLFEKLKAKYPNAYNCIMKIEECLIDVYEIEMTRAEQVYLMLHVYRVAEKAN
ncbi:MAG: BglG family transcription antiterminator LicT [Culicoidibacterales bacterium]